MFDFLCANGTKKDFKDRTIVFQALVQDGGAIISLVWLIQVGRAPRRLPVIARRKTKINENASKTFDNCDSAQEFPNKSQFLFNRNMVRNSSPIFEYFYLLSHNEIWT